MKEVKNMPNDNGGQFQEGSDRAREAGQKGGQSSSGGNQ